MTEQLIEQEIAKINNEISVMFKEHNKLVKEVIDLKKENDLLYEEIRRLYKLQWDCETR